MKMDYGTVTFKGKEYTLTDQAEFTNRQLEAPYTNYNEAEEGEEFDFEMSAGAIDEAGNEFIVYWTFSDVKGQQKELDEFEYDIVDRVEEL